MGFSHNSQRWKTLALLRLDMYNNGVVFSAYEVDSDF